MSSQSSAALLGPLQKTRLHEEIVDRLKDKILARELLPGEKLPTERDLAASLNVNRSTVRAALNKLESMDLVEIRHGDGVYVRDYLESGSLDLVRHLLYKDGAPDMGIVSNLAHLRRVIIPEIGYAAARNRSAEDLLALERVVFQSPDMPMAEKDWRVHNIIARASGNVLFVVLLNAFTGMLEDYAHLYFTDPGNVRVSAAFHKEIYGAIKARRPGKARKIMQDVFVYAERALFKALAAQAAAGKGVRP